MIDLENLCFNCFNSRPDGEQTCPHCGYRHTESILQYPISLPAGSVLDGHYILGRVLGQGGFGITYLALDCNLRIKVAIKEYLPDGIATRLPETTQVTVFTGEKEENFRYGAERFLDEARVLAKFVGNKNIANVRTYFAENNTSYFVMDFIEGISFKTYLKDSGGHVSWQKSLEVLIPVLDALTPVHREGFIHRDVTPDNIYITRDHEIKLLDFGSARYSLGNKSKSLDVILKAGYAPKEQYMRKGKQGPYTDVYSVAACFYAATSGYLPPEALERMELDEIACLSATDVDIPPALEEVIMKGLSVQPENRYQTAEAFRTALLTAADMVVTPIIFDSVTSFSSSLYHPEREAARDVPTWNTVVPPQPALLGNAAAPMPPMPPDETLFDEIAQPVIAMKKAKTEKSMNKKQMLSVAGVACAFVVCIFTLLFVPRIKEQQTVASAGGQAISSAYDPATQSASSASSEPEEDFPYLVQYHIPCKFDYVEIYIDGYARCQQNEKWGYLDTNGDFAVEPIYDNLAYFSDDYAIFTKDNKFGYLDRGGVERIPAQFSNAFNFEDGIAAVSRSDGQYYFINKMGNEVFDGARFKYAAAFVNGYAPVLTDKGATLLSKDGVLGKYYYEKVRNLDEKGLALVMQDGKWGYAYPDMSLCIPPRFSEASPFETDGIAFVRDEDGMYHIDTQGRQIDEQKWDKTWGYSGGYSTVFKDGYYGYVNQEGMLVLPLQYEDVWSFQNGLCPVKEGSAWRYIDPSGKTILTGGWREAYLFAEGFAKVKKGSSYGLIDRQGTLVLPYDFEDMLFHSNGMVPVKKNGLWGYYYIQRTDGLSPETLSLTTQ